MHLAVLLADYAGTLVVSNRIELRGRETEAAPPLLGTAALGTGLGTTAATVPNPGIDLVDIPTAHLELKGHTWDTTLDYSAFAIIPDLETGRPIPEILHTAALGEVWHDRTVRLSLFEYAQYGEENPAYLLSATNPQTGGVPTGVLPQPGAPLPTTGGPSVQLLANPVSVLYGSSRTDFTSQVALSRRWLSTTLLDYSVQGGADAAAQEVLPLVFGPRAEQTLRWSVTRIDAIESKVTGAHSDASAGPCFTALLQPLPVGSICEPTGDIAVWTETWRRRMSRHTDAWIGAGPAFAIARLLPAAPYVYATYPSVLAGFIYRSSVETVRTILRLDAQLAPVVDLRSGIVDDRAQGTLSLQLPLRDVTMTGALSGTRSVESLLSQPVESVQGSFEIEDRIDPELSVGAGARYAWQEETGLGAFSSGLVFIQATFRTRELRF
jgi:hypothetical protein